MTESDKLPPLKEKCIPPVEIGWAEAIDFPLLGLSKIRAKIDTGAATSSIHATRVSILDGCFDDEGRPMLEFYFRHRPGDKPVRCTAPLVMQKKIKSSNGEIQHRYMVETNMCLGDFCWKGKITLANRRKMAFPILIGRRALRRGFLVNCAKRWTQGKAQGDI